jgi:hypothetical protein
MSILVPNMDQVAGNDWVRRTPTMLVHSLANDFTKGISFIYANSMIPDMEKSNPFDDAGLAESLATLQEKYVFRNPDGIEEFVGSHRPVALLLIEAAPYLAEAFGNHATLNLETMPDQDVNQPILALATWDRSAAEARAALNVFDEGWLANNFQAINGRIVFDYELI